MSRSSDRAALTALLAALQDGDAPAFPDTDGNSETALLAVARHHRLTPMLSTTCGPQLSAGLAQCCRRDRIITTARNLLLGEATRETVRALAARQVRAVLLKGLCYEETLYGTPGCRPTSDIDLLVADGDRRVAFSVLDQLGYEPKATSAGFDDATYHEVSWTRGLVSVDLHMALAPLARCAIDYGEVWAQVRPLELAGAGAPTLALAPAHAAVFHALHMAIDHFDVPALYLLDFARLVPGATDVAAAGATARRWRCHRPLATAMILTAAFLPRWAGREAILGLAATDRQRADPIVAAYGPRARVSRVAQLRRKLSHIDTLPNTAAYIAGQSWRKVRELWMRGQSPRTRLGLEPEGASLPSETAQLGQK